MSVRAAVMEALALVRPGGTVIEPGTFVDMGDGLDDVGAALELAALKVLVTPELQGDTL